MSKMDELRAMREARYERATARAKQPPEKADTAGTDLCGHRAISGRTCTRERGHSAKSHRYS